MMNRRNLLFGAVGSAVAVGVGVWAVPRGAVPSVQEAVRMLTAWRGRAVASSGAWSPHQVFDHLTQSVDYSITGYPEPKSAIFQGTAGRAAFAVFSKRGVLTHGLTDPVPGAPSLGDGDPQEALAGLIASLERFDSFRGELQPHFAYGSLDKASYARAHVMHLQGHLTELSTT